MSHLPRRTILATTLGPPDLSALAELVSRPRLERLHSDVVSLLERRSIATLLLTLYYLAIIIGLIVLYGRGDFSTPSFVYQAF